MKHSRIRYHCTDFWSNWSNSCWIRALNVNFSIFCALLYRTSLNGPFKHVMMLWIYYRSKKSLFLECRPKWLGTTKNFSFLNSVFRYRIYPRWHFETQFVPGKGIFPVFLMMYHTVSFQWFLKSENPDMHSINGSHRGPIDHIIKIIFQITSLDHKPKRSWPWPSLKMVRISYYDSPGVCWSSSDWRSAYL